MKKLLSILLALMMVVGVGGAVSASASTANVAATNIGEALRAGASPAISVQSLSPNEGFTKQDYENWIMLMPIMPYLNLGLSYIYGWAAADEIIAALLPGKNIMSFIFESYELSDYVVNNNEALFAQGRLQTVLDETLAKLDALHATYFTSDFLATFGAYKTAYTNGTQQALRLESMVNFTWMRNYGEIIAAYDALTKTFEADSKNIEETGSLQAQTAYFAKLAADSAAIIARIDTSPFAWWELLPSFLQWILRWIFFGWIWM